MRRGLGFKLMAALLIYANLLPPALLLAQTSKPAGVVSALKGEVLITRASLPQQSRPLKFKDEVFFHDRITTKEQSLVRVLMGGKALITVRELSDLTITEEPGKPSLIDLAKGKIGLAVARARMSPGESIEVRTPNAVAAVRGTVIVVEVLPAAAAPGAAEAEPDYRPMRTSFTGQATPVQAPSFTTNFHVLKGHIDVTSLAAPGSPPVSIGAGLSVSVAGGNVGAPQPSPPTQQIVRGLKADPQHQGAPDETTKTVGDKQQATATALANLIAPPPAGSTEKKEEGTSSGGGGDKTLTDASSGGSLPGGSGGTTTDSTTTNTNTTTTNTTTTNTILSTTGCTTDCPGSTPLPPPPAGQPLVTVAGFSPSITLNAPLGLVQSGATTAVPTPLSLPTVDIPVPDVTVQPIGLGQTAGQVLVSGLNGEITTPYFATSAPLQTVILSGGIGLTDTHVAAGGSTVFAVSGTNAIITGSALALSNSTITGTGRVLTVFESGFTSTSTNALIALDGSSSIDMYRLVQVDGESADSGLVLIGPALSAADSMVIATNNLISVGARGFLGVASTLPLVALDNSTLQASSLLVISTGALDVDGNVVRGAELGGSVLLAQNNSSITTTSDLIQGTSGSILKIDAGLPLVSIADSTLTVNGGVLFSLTGSTTESQTVEGNSLTLGTDQPLRGSGTCPSCPLQATLLSASGSTISTDQALKLDTALLETIAPLLNLTAGSTMTSASDLVNLVQQAKLATATGFLSTDALVKLNASALTVTSGALFNVAGGSFLSVPTGSLFKLDNNSTLNILSGPLMLVSGGSVFKLVNGSLGTFGTGTNLLSFGSAPLCSLGTCVSLLSTGYKILLLNGAVSGNVLIDSTFTTFAGLGGSNTISGLDSTRALLVLDGASSTLALGLVPVLQGAPAGNVPLVTLTGYGFDELILNAPLGFVGTDGPTSVTPQSFTAPDFVPDTPYLALDDGSGVVVSGGIGLIDTIIDGNFSNIFEVNDASVTIGGSALSLTNSSITNANVVLRLYNTMLTGTSTAALIALDSSSSITANQLVTLDHEGGSPTLVDLAGPALAAAGNSSVTLSGDLILVYTGNTLVAASLPLVTLDNSTIQASRLLVVDFNSTVTLGGSLLTATNNSTIQTSGDGVSVFGGTLTTTSSSDPLIALTNSSANFSGNVLADGESSDVTLAGSLLTVSGRPISGGTSVTASRIADVSYASLTVGGSILSVINTTAPASDVADVSLSSDLISVTGTGSTLTTTGSSSIPLVSLTNTSLGLRDDAVFGNGVPNVLLVQSGGMVDLAGPLLVATAGSSIALEESALRVESGGTLIGRASSALIQLDSSTIEAGIPFDCGGCDTVLVNDGTVQLISGTLLSATNSTLTEGGPAFISFSNGSQLTVTGTSEPLVKLTGGTLNLGNASFFLVTGSSTVTLSGPLFQTSGTTITNSSNPGAFVSLSGSFLTVGGPVLDLDLTDAPLVSLGSQPLISLSNSTLTTTSGPAAIKIIPGSLSAGSAVSLTGGSTLDVTGDLVQVGVGSTLSLSGALLAASGTPDVSISGNLLGLATGAAQTLTNSILAMSGGTVSAGGGVNVPLAASLTQPATNSVLTSVGGNFNASPRSLAITPDGTRAYVANLGNNTVSAINISTNTVIGAPITVGVQPFAVAITPDSAKVYVANAAVATVSIIDTASNTVTSGATVGSSLNNQQALGVAITPDGTRAYVSVSAGSLPSSTVVLLQVDPGAPADYFIRSQFNVAGAGGVAISPSGNLAYVTTGGSVSVIDTNPTHIDLITPGSPFDTYNTVIATVVVGGQPSSVAFTPNGTRAYVTNSSDGTVSVISTASSTVIATVNVGSGPRAVAISPDGTRAYVSNQFDGTISVINTSTNTVIATVIAGGYGVAITPDGARAYVGNGFSVEVIGDSTQPLFKVAGGTFTAGGSLLTANGGSVNVAGDIANVSGGGVLVTGPTAALVSLTGGTHTISTGATAFTATNAAMFNLSGVNTTAETDPFTTDAGPSGTGLTVGTDRPLQGPAGAPVPVALLEATNATVTTNQAVRLDTALLEATMPLIQLAAATNMTSNSHLFNLANQAKLFGNVPGDALVRLNNSMLTVSNGSLFNVAGGSYLNVVGNLFSLTNSSTLNITNGGLVALSGGSVFNLTGSFGSFGAGTNALSLPTSLSGYTVNTTLGFGVALATGTSITQVVATNFTPFTGLTGSNTATTNGIVLKIADATSKVKLCTSSC